MTGQEEHPSEMLCGRALFEVLARRVACPRVQAVLRVWVDCQTDRVDVSPAGSHPRSCWGETKKRRLASCGAERV